MSIRVLSEADARTELEGYDIYWGRHLRRVKKNKREGERLRITMPVWHYEGERVKEETPVATQFWENVSQADEVSRAKVNRGRASTWGRTVSALISPVAADALAENKLGGGERKGIV